MNLREKAIAAYYRHEEEEQARVAKSAERNAETAAVSLTTKSERILGIKPTPDMIYLHPAVTPYDAWAQFTHDGLTFRHYAAGTDSLTVMVACQCRKQWPVKFVTMEGLGLLLVLPHICGDCQTQDNSLDVKA